MATATLDDYSKITANVTKLSVSVRDLSKYTESIGTPKDSRDLRSKTKETREQTQKLILETRQLLGKPFAKEDKIKHDKLAKNFNDILSGIFVRNPSNYTEYEQVSKANLRKEQEFVIELERRRSTVRGSTMGQPDSNSQGMQLQEVAFTDVDEQILQERNAEMKEIEQNLEQLAECFLDVANEVQAQGEDLNTIENNTSKAHVAVEYGVDELKEANRLLTKRRICYLIIILVLIVVIIAIALIIYFTTKDDDKKADETTTTTTTGGTSSTTTN